MAFLTVVMWTLYREHLAMARSIPLLLTGKEMLKIPPVLPTLVGCNLELKAK